MTPGCSVFDTIDAPEMKISLSKRIYSSISGIVNIDSKVEGIGEANELMY